MKARRTAVAAQRARLETQRTVTYRPAPMPWKSLLVSAGVVMLLAVLTAPGERR